MRENLRTIPRKTSEKRMSQPPKATRPRCRLHLLAGIALAAMLLLTGCQSVRPRQGVIAVEGDQVPHKIRRGEISHYDGWILPTPLFNRLTPCFKSLLESPEPGQPRTSLKASSAFPVASATSPSRKPE